MPKLLVNKVKINYEEVGEGYPIIFLHGSGFSWRFWEPQLLSISKQFRMILLDLRGNGESDRTFGMKGYDYEQMAIDIELFMNEAGIRRAHMVGMGDSAIIASLFAAKNPERVNKLVLSNPRSYLPKSNFGLLKIVSLIYPILPFQFIKIGILSKYNEDKYSYDILNSTFSFDKKTYLMYRKSRTRKKVDSLLQANIPTMVVVNKSEANFFGNLKDRVILVVMGNKSKIVNITQRDEFNNLIINYFQDKEIRVNN